MEKNLYEYFNCSNREELYKKVEEKDESIKELLNYFEYAKKELGINFKENKKVIRTRNELQEYYSNGNMPGKKEISILILDVGCRILKDFKVKENIDNLEFIKGCYTKTGRNSILMNNDCSYTKINSIREMLDTLGIRCLQEFEIKNNKKIFFSENGEELDWRIKESWFERKENLISYEIEEEKGIGLSNLKGYDEFLEFYSKKELKGLNILLDEDKITEILVLKNQHLSQEHFSVINYDNNFNIMDYSIKYIGATDHSPIETISVVPNLIDEKVNGLIILHNHPSGKIEPSKSDIEITKAFEKLCKNLNKTLYDHIIVSRTGSFSFRKEGLIDDISNEVKDKIIKKKTNPLIEKIQAQRESKEQNINKGLTRE